MENKIVVVVVDGRSGSSGGGGYLRHANQSGLLIGVPQRLNTTEEESLMVVVVAGRDRDGVRGSSATGGCVIWSAARPPLTAPLSSIFTKQAIVTKSLYPSRRGCNESVVPLTPLDDWLAATSWPGPFIGRESGGRFPLARARHLSLTRRGT